MASNISGFLFTPISGHHSLKCWKSWTFPNFRTISVYIDVNFVCLWCTWDQNILSQNSASKTPTSWSTLVQIMACCELDTTPLPEQMLIYWQLEPYKQTSVKSESKYIKKMHLKMLSAKRLPFCSSLYVLIPLALIRTWPALVLTSQ